MKQRPNDDERDHPKDLADATDALRLAVSSKRKDVWTWLRLTVFFGSLVANAGFWFYTKHLEDKVRIADYNDKSWAAYESFDESLRKLEAAEQKDTQELMMAYRSLYSGLIYSRLFGGGPGPSETEVFEQVRKVDAEWIGDITVKLTELHTKLTSYRSACGCSLKAIDVAKKKVASLRSPAQRAQVQIEDDANNAAKLYRAVLVDRGANWLEMGSTAAKLASMAAKFAIMKDKINAEALYKSLLDRITPLASEDARLIQNSLTQ